jgi:CubicO group peptidase (beta-lactamase class C family)
MTVTTAAVAGLIETLEDQVPEVLTATGTPGASVAVGWGGRPRLALGFGQADLARRHPFAAGARLPVASISKLYTATAVLQIVEHGRCDLDEPVAGLLPDLDLANPRGGPPITLRDLLTFRSGLATDHVDAALEVRGALADHVHAELTRGVRRPYDGRDEHGAEVSLWGAPTRSNYQYSNLGIDLAGLVVERHNAAGLDFAAYVETHVLAPLGIARAFDWPGDVAGYVRCGRQLTAAPAVRTASLAAAGLVLSAPEHLRWMLAMLNEGQLGAARLLDAPSVAELLAPQVAPAYPGGNHTGLVVESGGLGANRWFGELGAFPWGWISESRAYPALDLAVVVCTNRWDLGRGFPPRDECAHGLIVDLVRDHRARRADPSERPPWAWRRAYVRGLLMADRLHGVLDLRAPLPDDEVRRMAGAYTTDGKPMPHDGWDPEGFVAGFRARVGRATPADVRALVDAAAVTRDELQLCFATAGRARGVVPIPSTSYSMPDADEHDDGG